MSPARSQLIKTIGSEQAVQYLYLLNESNFRERFPACTQQLRQRAKAIASAESRSENGSVASTSSLSKATAGSPAKPKTEAEDAIGREAMELGEVETVTAILDIKGAGIMTFWKVKDLLGQVIQISDVGPPDVVSETRLQGLTCSIRADTYCDASAVTLSGNRKSLIHN